MRSRVLWRRSATALGVYGATALGFLATVVAARELTKLDFARFALVFATTTLVQNLVDLTIEEVVVKYGNRYAAREEWGRFHRLIRVGMVVKLVGGTVGTLGILVAAVLSPWIWSTGGIGWAMAIAALVPLIQQPEGMAGALLLLRNRYDIRGVLLLWSMALRLVGIVIAAPHGVVAIFIAIVSAQTVATATVTAAGYAAYRRYPAAEPVELGGDRVAIRAFTIQSSLSSGLASFRSYLPTALVGIVSSANQVSNFRNAQAPQTAMQSLSAPARLVLLAEQTRDVEHGRPDKAFASLKTYIAGMAAFALVATVPLWVFMPNIVVWVYGAKYRGAEEAFRVMLLAAAVQIVFGWTKSFPVSIGRPGLRTAGQTLEVAVLVPAVLVLGRLYGATGAAGGVLAGGIVLALFWTGGLFWLRGRLVAEPHGTPA